MHFHDYGTDLQSTYAFYEMCLESLSTFKSWRHWDIHEYTNVLTSPVLEALSAPGPVAIVLQLRPLKTCLSC